MSGKGPNTVISLLHHFFEHHGLGETELSLNADNCAGQNKNNTMMQVCVYLICMHKYTNKCVEDVLESIHVHVLSIYMYMY